MPKPNVPQEPMTPPSGLRAILDRPLNWLWLAVLIYVADFYTKAWASSSLYYGQSIEILPFLNWTLAHNTGAAFSFLHDAGGWQRWFFVGIAVVVSVALIIWMARLPRGSRWLPLALALLLGGAVGNLHDRLVQGYVVDFIHVYWQNWHFPAFNIADCGITVGAIMLIIDSLIFEPRRERAAKAQEHQQ
ncbi:signal peptidase II [Paraperlucidibaca baekdonensis]|uniref:Lipoprotein signal peptidase n=1 Tax=Paraperlucidibaca baekdonensis TaxID=748120 RepID=A0A3E0HBF4_9GAMM|nr:signal peptidase II [Paraperlucidibaca baekdonensis]